MFPDKDFLYAIQLLESGKWIAGPDIRNVAKKHCPVEDKGEGEEKLSASICPLVAKTASQALNDPNPVPTNAVLSVLKTNPTVTLYSPNKKGNILLFFAISQRMSTL